MRLDPRTKLLILAVTSVSVFVNKSIAVECVLAGIPLVLLSVSGNLKRMLKYAAFFLALLLIQLFIVPRLPVTFGGIVYMFAVYIRKLLPCFILGSFLIATTSVSRFLAAITKLRLSKGLTIALAVTLRYFPTMREEWASIRDAMALRGISASAAGLISHPIQTMEHVYVPLLVSASRISDEITQAAITRGIEHTGERSCISGKIFASENRRPQTQRSKRQQKKRAVTISSPLCRRAMIRWRAMRETTSPAEKGSESPLQGQS